MEFHKIEKNQAISCSCLNNVNSGPNSLSFQNIWNDKLSGSATVKRTWKYSLTTIITITEKLLFII